MNPALAVALLIAMTTGVQGNAEKDPHHDQSVDEIANLKTRLKSLRDFIDGQSGTVAVAICDAFEEFGKSIKCLTAPAQAPVTKRTSVDFPNKFPSAPVVAGGITGMQFMFGVDVHVSTQDIQEDFVQLQVKSESLFSPFSLSSGFFSCPHSHEHVHGQAHSG